MICEYNWTRGLSLGSFLCAGMIYNVDVIVEAEFQLHSCSASNVQDKSAGHYRGNN